MANRQNPPLGGVHCGVENCMFNENCRCCADKISVNPQFFDSIAVSSAETVCETFVPR